MSIAVILLGVQSKELLEMFSETLLDILTSFNVMVSAMLVPKMLVGVMLEVSVEACRRYCPRRC